MHPSAAALLLIALLVLAGCAASGPAGESARFRGATLNYTDHGPRDADEARSTVVLVHGWGSSLRAWKKQVEPLAAERRVIALDLPGYGDSEDVDAEHSMDLYADAIAAVLDDADVCSAVLVGHSNGTPTVRQFYRRYPERTDGLVAVDGALKQVFTREMAAPVLTALRGDDHEAFLREMFAQMGSRMANQDEADEALEILLDTPQRVLLGGFEAGQDPEIWHDDGVDAPLLVVNARAPFWTDDYVDYVRALGENVEYRVVDDASHFVMMDRPEAFNRLVLDWLGEHGW